MARKRAADPADQKTAILETIVHESRSVGTDATKRSADIGKLCLEFMEGFVTRTGDRKLIQDRLKAEGLDANVTRLIQVYGLVRLHPEATGLPLSVVTRITPLIEFKHGPDQPDSPRYKAGHDRHVPDLVRQAIQHKWTAETARAEIAKVRPPIQRTARKSPGTLKKAVQALAKADLDDISEALLASPAAEKKLREVLTEFDDTRSQSAA